MSIDSVASFYHRLLEAVVATLLAASALRHPGVPPSLPRVVPLVREAGRNAAPEAAAGVVVVGAGAAAAGRLFQPCCLTTPCPTTCDRVVDPGKCGGG